MTILSEVVPSTQEPLVATASIDVPSWEELDELLERFPMFIAMKSPITNMNDLFSATLPIPIKVDNDLKQIFIARGPHKTLGEAVEAIMWIKDYTAFRWWKW